MSSTKACDAGATRTDQILCYVLVEGTQASLFLKLPADLKLASWSTSTSVLGHFGRSFAQSLRSRDVTASAPSNACFKVIASVWKGLSPIFGPYLEICCR